MPGWLVVIPRRHVLALDELTLEESAELGPLLSGLTAALRQVVQCEKTYVALFSEAEGFEHLHFHVIPRRPGLDPTFFGPRVFGLLGGDPALHVPDTARDQIAANLAHALPIRPLASPASTPSRVRGMPLRGECREDARYTRSIVIAIGRTRTNSGNSSRQQWIRVEFSSHNPTS
jgi:diadenosine tetraphosphate (Ap4A) HIT family hydrolase